MKNVLILGLGGSGAWVVNAFFANRNQEERISCLAIDSDIEAIGQITGIPALCLTEYTSLGNVIDKLEKDTVSEFFPCDDSQGKVGFFRTLEMGRGANGWRMKGLLSFESMLSDPEKSAVFFDFLNRQIDRDDPDGQIEIVIVSSLAGGTGGALFLPVAMYLKRYYKNRYNRDVTVKALLSCPDVYVDALTSENKVKAYANAYAALSELNAVDLVSKGYNGKAQAESKCKISFKIGSEKSKGIGVLFDSSKPEFAVSSAQPFQTVYLFDRIPGTNSIAAYERIMAKMIGLILDDNDGKASSEIYAGFSLAEIVFASESIVDYVAKKKVFEELGSEYLSLYRTTLDEGWKESGSDEIYRFAKSFTDTYQSIYTKSAYHRHLALNREKETDDIVPDMPYAEPVVSVKYIQEYIQSLTDEFYALFLSENKEVKDALQGKDAEIVPIKLFDSKTAKIKKLNAVKDKAIKYNEILIDYYKSCAKTLKEQKDKIQTALLDASNQKSLLNHLIIYQGTYLHPVMALLLLSDAYRKIKENLDSEFDKIRTYDEIRDEKELPDEIFQKADLESHINEEYAKFGTMRLKKIAALDINELSPKLTCAGEDIRKDFSDIYYFITDKCVEYCIRATLKTVGGLIEKYRKLLDGIPVLLDDHKVDVKLALIANTSDTCTRMNVGCTEEIKEETYRKYMKEIEYDYSCDKCAGRVFYEYLDKEDKENLFEDLAKAEKEEICNAKIIKRISGQNIFRVLHDRDIFKENLSDRTEYNDFKQAFALAALPLDMTVRDELSKDAAQVDTVTMVSVSSAEFARGMLKDENLTLQQAVCKYLYLQGSFESDIKVTDIVPGNVVLATKKIHDFPLYLFNKINESDEGYGYYKYYKKAISVKRDQNTQMWNPHLVKENTGDFLPFINPVKRDEFEKNIYRAVLYMLKNGLLFVDKDESKHEIFYLLQGEHRYEVVFEHKHVLVENPELLFGFIRENAELAEHLGSAFDRELEKEITVLPPVGFETTDLPVFRQAIWNSATVKFLRKDLMASTRSERALEPKRLVDLIYEMSEKEDTVSEAVNLGKAVSSVIKEFVYSRPFSDREIYESLYKEIVKDFRNEYEQDAKNEGRNLYAEKSEKTFSLIEAEGK